MEKEVFSGKTNEEAKENALLKLNLQEQDVIFKEMKTTKTLFSKKYEIEVIKKSDIIDIAKQFIVKILNSMGISSQVEYKVRDDILYFNIITNKASLLIGRQGKNIDCLQTVVNAYIYEELGFYYKIYIDICDYKKEREKKLEKIAKQMSKDVIRSGCEVKLDPMNSYERRIIHNALSNNKNVTTESFGEEPNRYVVIKPKD